VWRGKEEDPRHPPVRQTVLVGTVSSLPASPAPISGGRIRIRRAAGPRPAVWLASPPFG
jgi:hypothetical protein